MIIPTFIAELIYGLTLAGISVLQAEFVHVTNRSTKNYFNHETYFIMLNVS